MQEGWMTAVIALLAFLLSCYLLVRDHRETRRSRAFDLFKQWADESSHRKRADLAVLTQSVVSGSKYSGMSSDFRHAFGYVFHMILAIDAAVQNKFISRKFAKALFGDTLLNWSTRFTNMSLQFDGDDGAFGLRIRAAVASIQGWAS